MLLELLYELRARRVKVGLGEWLALMEALARGLHDSSLTGFYHLARSLLCHSEAQFDAFDEAFALVFQGVEGEAFTVTEEILEWLADPARLLYLSAEERARLEALDLDELRRRLEERLREQREDHRGGHRFIGSGGTSPFGQGGIHPTGVRIGGGGGRSALKVAAERRFRAYRDDLVLDVRQIKVALRRLRELRREGLRDELDLERTIDRTSRNAGELELEWRAPRRNNVKVLLLMDVGGSMDPHAVVVSQLFSAAAQSKHFRDFHAFYFHNCVYGRVYRTAGLRDGLPVAEVLASYGPNYKVVMVGDAMMHPSELFAMGGAIDYWSHEVTPGIEWLRRLSHHFERKVWLNPEPRRYWRHETVHAIRGLFPMFPLTLEGLSEAVAALVKGKGTRQTVEPPVWENPFDLLR
jgi:uncharacterized protein with von Willebrand factor type A (vWA) domain